MNLFTKWYCNGNTLPHNWNFWGCCEAEAAILLFSVSCSWFSKVLLFVFVTKINSQLLMQHDWFMYHLRSTYKNRPDFPFKRCFILWGGGGCSLTTNAVFCGWYRHTVYIDNVSGGITKQNLKTKTCGAFLLASSPNFPLLTRLVL